MQNRIRVLDVFHERFDYKEFVGDIPPKARMYNTLVDDLLAIELTEHDLEMVVTRIRESNHSDIGCSFYK